jgi:hypothetical protein
MTIAAAPNRFVETLQQRAAFAGNLMQYKKIGKCWQWANHLPQSTRAILRRSSSAQAPMAG